jgi:hypothetical protein
MKKIYSDDEESKDLEGRKKKKNMKGGGGKQLELLKDKMEILRMKIVRMEKKDKKDKVKKEGNDKKERKKGKKKKKTAPIQVPRICLPYIGILAMNSTDWLGGGYIYLPPYSSTQCLVVPKGMEIVCFILFSIYFLFLFISFFQDFFYLSGIREPLSRESYSPRIHFHRRVYPSLPLPPFWERC